MQKKILRSIQAACFGFFILPPTAFSQVLTLPNAIQTALNNYGTIKAKTNYVKTSEALVKVASVDYLPNLNLAAQQAYGSAVGQFGPVIVNGGLGSASSGPTFSAQNWNAAFGGLYLANINWDFFTFGKVRGRVKVAESEAQRDASDLEQEKFQHEVRVAGAYLNLLAAQRLRLSQQRNLDRAISLRTVVMARALSGLNPGVDSSQANAEVSSAKIELTNAINYEEVQANYLSQLMGVSVRTFVLDTIFINRVPAALYDSSAFREEAHPILKYYQTRINLSKEQEKYFDRFKYPSLTLSGVFQGRASGFGYNYSESNPGALTHNYWDGVNPSRTNYLVGVGVTWGLTNIKRVNEQVAAQEWTSKGLQSEYELVNQQIRAQIDLANQRMKNAVDNYTEAPVQMKAASDAYVQKSVLYRNGLTNIVDVSQSLYILNRAETDKDISVNNVWQALLLKAAASGDFGLFENDIQ